MSPISTKCRGEKLCSKANQCWQIVKNVTAIAPRTVRPYWTVWYCYTVNNIFFTVHMKAICQIYEMDRPKRPYATLREPQELNKRSWYV